MSADFAALSQFAQQQIMLFVLVLTRLTLMLIATPALAGGVPRQVKVFLVVAITVLLLPIVGAGDLSQLAAIRTPVDMAIALAREALVGLMIGLVIQLLVIGLQTAGELISGTGGMQLGDTFDPGAGTSMPVIARLIGMLATAVMIAVGGHREMFDALLGSFESMPPGRGWTGGGTVELLTHELSLGLAAGVRAGAPVVLALLLANLITGLLSRTLPQLNVLAIGLSVNALALIAVLAISIGSIATVFEDEFSDAVRMLRAHLTPAVEASAETEPAGA